MTGSADGDVFCCRSQQVDGIMKGCWEVETLPFVPTLHMTMFSARLLLGVPGQLDAAFIHLRNRSDSCDTGERQQALSSFSMLALRERV